jgi:hypothetical protein
VRGALHPGAGRLHHGDGLLRFELHERAMRHSADAAGAPGRRRKWWRWRSPRVRPHRRRMHRGQLVLLHALSRRLLRPAGLAALTRVRNRCGPQRARGVAPMSRAGPVSRRRSGRPT